ncbi:MAG: hypothetical protein IJC31_00050 [Spirochaetaceae bacterium]|nr:hypothetical protein [Spirochaetaceae bacterium]
MKRKYIVTLLLIAAATTSFFGCKNGLTMFEQIDQETKLEDAVITGVVNSVVKFNSKLYASDGNLYTKNENDVRGWSKIGSPAGTIIKLAATGEYLYALNEEKELYFLGKDSGTWQPVPTSTIGTVETIFFDGWQTAYLKANGKFYKLSAAMDPAHEGSITSAVMVKTKADDTYTASGGTVTGTSSVPDSPSLGSVSGLGEVYSLTHSQVDNAIYAGTSKGLKKLPMHEDGKLTGEVKDPPGNWGATIKEYEAFAVLATGKNSSDSALYSSTIATGSAGAKVNGLWGYYYSRRDNWNRE